MIHWKEQKDIDLDIDSIIVFSDPVFIGTLPCILTLHANVKQKGVLGSIYSTAVTVREVNTHKYITTESFPFLSLATSKYIEILSKYA